MSATIEINGEQCTVENGKWSSSNPQLQELCETVSASKSNFNYEPDPDLAQAQYVISVIGGKISAVTKPEAIAEGTVC